MPKTEERIPESKRHRAEEGDEAGDEEGNDEDHEERHEECHELRHDEHHDEHQEEHHEEGDKAGDEEGHEADNESQDNGLMAEFTDKVVMLEQDMLSKNECISALSGHVDDLKAKNGNYARELSRLSVTVNKLVDASHENIDMMIQLE